MATDSDGVTRTSSPVSVTVRGMTNQPPIVSLTSPAASSTFTAPATITFAATASDSDGTVTRVDFYRGSTLIGSDTSSPYSYNWTNVATGSYQLSAVARDDDGATRTSTGANVTVSTRPNQLPTVSITNPIAGRSFTAPASLTITAAASDSDGTIARVDFYANSQLIVSDTTSPYQAAWKQCGCWQLLVNGRRPRQLGRYANVERGSGLDHGGCTQADAGRLYCLRESCDQRHIVYRRDLSRRGSGHRESCRHA